MNKYTAYIISVREAKDRPKDFLPTPPETPPYLDMIVSEMALVHWGYSHAEIGQMTELDVRARVASIPLLKCMYPSLGG